MPQHQMHLDLIPHQVNGSIIDQRAKDGYINATALCQAAGKKWSHYWSILATQEFLAELATDAGIPASTLVQSVKGGIVQGTWVHPQVAINLAQWLSAKFAVQVSKWVHEWMNGSGAVVDIGITPKGAAHLPPHIRRYLLNQHAVPHGCFTILQEITFLLTGPLEALGHELAEHFLPDGSLGKMFCAHLRSDHGYDTSGLPKYTHTFEDGRKVLANAYPDDLLAVFRKYALEFWLPKHAPKYFKDRDPSVLPLLNHLPALAAPKVANLPVFKARA